jgi:hypothetical protein
MRTGENGAVDLFYTKVAEHGRLAGGLLGFKTTTHQQHEGEQQRPKRMVTWHSPLCLCLMGGQQNLGLGQIAIALTDAD